MSSSSERKLKEKELLIKRIFPAPYARVESSLVLFRICRDIGGTYCSKFKENGYTEKFQEFKTDEVIAEATKLLNDEDLLRFSSTHKGALNSWRDFKGEYYAYDHKTKALRVGSDWSNLRKNLDTASVTFGKNNVLAYLEGVWDANITHDTRLNNYVLVRQLFKEHGGSKSFLEIATRLNAYGIVEYRKSGRGVDILVSDEIVPLVAELLHKNQ